VGRLQDGSRKITHISEVLGYDMQTQTYQMQDIYVRRYLGFTPDGKIESEIVPSGILPRCIEQLHEHGMDFPSNLYDAVRAAGGRVPHSPLG
jgi:pilus assembly protein CpaF